MASDAPRTPPAGTQAAESGQAAALPTAMPDSVQQLPAAPLGPQPLASPSPSTSTSTSASHAHHQQQHSQHHMGGYPHTQDLAQYLTQTFAPQVQPLPDEYMAKETARVYLEKLAQDVAPGAKLLPFGSMANGFALKNSDMDLCCLLDKDHPPRPASELVELLGKLIERETNFHVKMLPRARIPIIKLTMPPTPSVPFGMSCDIGFENRLALENTRLLRTYSLVDPRLRTLVLFLKVWTKRRKINNPYRGTLSSYGFVLLVIHFLAQVKKPPVLPNLQQLALTRSVALDELEYEGNDIAFFDDLDALPRVWHCANTENVGDLLIEFFRYFAKDFTYNHSVISIRSEIGCLTKESKGWQQDAEYDPDVIVRDQHKFCIEDPFQLDYNVGRTVTRDGLYTIRGEFMRAFRLMSSRSSGHWASIINDVCEEREDYLVQHPPIDHRPSPRRRSAPSPRMMPHPGAGLPHPPPLVPPPPSGTSPSTIQDFRMWAAVNGAQHSLAVDPRVFARDTPMTSTNGPAGLQSPGMSLGEFGALDEPWDPATSSTYGSASSSTSPNHLASASFGGVASYRRQSNYARPSQTPTSPPASTSSQRPSLPTSDAPSLERRSSWDGSGSATTSNASYDLHRFFQNPTGESSTSSSSVQNAPHVVEPRSAMTAPSSPDLGPQNYYTNGGFMHGPGRSHYRYGAGGGTYPIGPRMAGMPSRSLHYGSHYQHHHHHNAPRHTWSPAPIFPEEDREAVALANSITFGNFPPPRAYKSGRSGSTGAHQTGYGPRSGQSGVTSPVRTSVLLDDEVNGGAQVPPQDDVGNEDAHTRGRRLMNDTIVMPSPDDVGFGVNRQRGRSVPHLRLGPDGRESILFGEIKVTLPRANDDSLDKRDGANKEQNGDTDASSSSVPSETEHVDHIHGPTPLTSASTLSPAVATVSLSPQPNRRQAIPSLTTQPPTPLKSAPSFTTFSPMPTTPMPQSPTDFLPAFASPPIGSVFSGAVAGATSGAGPSSVTDTVGVADSVAGPMFSPGLNGSPKLVPVPTSPVRSSAPWTSVSPTGGITANVAAARSRSKAQSPAMMASLESSTARLTLTESSSPPPPTLSSATGLVDEFGLALETQTASINGSSASSPRTLGSEGRNDRFQSSSPNGTATVRRGSGGR